MDEQSVEEKIKSSKRKRKRWIILLCWPLIIGGIWFIVSFIFWFISRTNWGGELFDAIRNFVNWILWLLSLLYLFALPAWIILVVDANGDLKKLDKDNSIK